MSGPGFADDISTAVDYAAVSVGFGRAQKCDDDEVVL